MASPHLMRVPKQSDRAVIELFRELARENQVSIVSLGLGAAGSIQMPSDGAFSEAVTRLLEIDSSLIESASINIPGFSITFYRGGYPTQDHAKSAIFDDVRFHHDQQASKLSEAQRLELLGKVGKAMRAFDPARTVGSGLSEEQEQLLAIHSSTLERLESLNAELVRGSEQFRRNLEGDFQKRSGELEEEFRKRSAELDAEFKTRKEMLDAKESALDHKLKAIDDRQNTHVRREIRKDILHEIRARSQEFRLTKGTNRLRWPVHVACIVLLLFLGVANVLYALELTSLLRLSDASTTGLTILGVKQALVSVAFGATAVFYIRWLNAWSVEHAAAEFALRQFQLDIERASWVVESALEWKDSKGNNMPSELLQPITRELFANRAQPETQLHPADELASALLGTAAKVRLKAADSEIELDGKKLKDL